MLEHARDYKEISRPEKGKETEGKGDVKEKTREKGASKWIFVDNEWRGRQS